MKIEFLKNFIKLTHYKSFSELANDIDISQSTLSNQINQLETEFGNVKLISRTTRKFDITEAGQTFLEFAKKIVDLYDECKKQLLEISLSSPTETIVITASTLPGSHILPKFIANFREKNPNVELKVVINNSSKSLELLKKDNADFAGIGSFMAYNQEEFDYIKIGEDSLVFVCSPKHDLLKRESLISLKDLIQYSFILREDGSGTRDVMERHFPKFNKLKVKLVINDNESIVSAVSASNYISILSEFIAKKAEGAGLIKILRVKEYPVIATRDIYFVKLKEKEITHLKQKFWNNLKSGIKVGLS